MIRHIVMFKFLPQADGRTKRENVLATKDMLDSLPAKIDLIRSSQTFVGADGSADSNYDLLLISDFDSFDDLNAYIVHPDHKAVGAFIGPLRESRSCIDTEM